MNSRYGNWNEFHIVCTGSNLIFECENEQNENEEINCFDQFLNNRAKKMAFLNCIGKKQDIMNICLLSDETQEWMLSRLVGWSGTKVSSNAFFRTASLLIPLWILVRRSLLKEEKYPQFNC